jgi:hypothetical protein
MKTLAIAVLLLSTGVAQADTILTKQVAQEIKQDSVLSMTAGVSLELASNLIAAQAASPWLDSLDLSIAAVLRAITIYDFPGGPKSLTETCCPAVWAQSTIAIDPNAGAFLSPTALYFGEVVVTPEPGIGLMLLVGGFALLAVRK